MNAPHTAAGGCHCGKVRFEVTGDTRKVVSCNCSICMKKGYLLAFVPAEQFRLLSGGDHLADYQFHRTIIHHLFCRTCGIEAFARGVAPDGAAMVAVNVRCLDDVDLEKLSITYMDGKSM